MSRRFLMLLALLAVAGGVGWLIYPVAPLYKGKPLTYWLRGYDDWPGVYSLGDATGPTRSDADAAVRHAGTNAIPTLLRLLQARDSALKLKVLRWWDSMHPPSQGRWTRAILLRSRAQSAFHALGPSAAPAVPALIHIYEGDRDPWVRGCAALSLGAIGPEARDACPAVVRGMISQTTNGILTMETIWALRSLKPAPELAVPALVKCLADPYSGVKQAAAEALVALGTNAASAVPVLVAMFQSSESGPVRDPALKAAVAAALNAIDPETAAREGVPKN